MINYLLFAFTFTSACIGVQKDDEFPGVAHELHWCFGLWLEKSFLHLSGLIAMLLGFCIYIMSNEIREGKTYVCVIYFYVCAYNV